MKKTLLLNFFVLCFASLVGAQEKSDGLTNELNRMINDGIKYEILEYENSEYPMLIKNYYLLEDGLLQNFELSEFYLFYFAFIYLQIKRNGWEYTVTMDI